MDFTNINDPAGIKALLEQLRASQAWQETNTDANVPQADGNLPYRDSMSATLANHLEPLEPASPVSSHISSLLSRLQSGFSTSSSLLPDTLPKAQSYRAAPEEPPLLSSSSKGHSSRYSSETKPPIPSSPTQPNSLRDLPFIKALPIVATLAEDPAFIRKLEKMREDQEFLEEKLWNDRRKILNKQEEKVKVALAKAAMVGTALDQKDASTLEITFSKELKAFYSEQALPVWDALFARQQSALEELGVPGMFVTAIKSDREKQMRIIQVLDGLSGSEDEDISGAVIV